MSVAFPPLTAARARELSAQRHAQIEEEKKNEREKIGRQDIERAESIIAASVDLGREMARVDHVQRSTYDKFESVFKKLGYKLEAYFSGPDHWRVQISW